MSNNEHLSLLHKPTPTHYHGMVLEDDRICLEMEVIQDENDPMRLYGCSIEFTDKRPKPPHHKTDSWDNDFWMFGIYMNLRPSWNALSEYKFNDSDKEVISHIITLAVKKKWIGRPPIEVLETWSR